MLRSTTACALLLSLVHLLHAADGPGRYTPEMSEFVRNFTPGGALSDGSPRPTPEESLAAFEVAVGLEVDAPLHEPTVRQPLNMNFDERGRLWVVQYLQYPYPAGLKITHYDKYLRAVFDRVPPAPPNHVRGRDQITIHEDTDGDGSFDRHKVFVDGLNIARSVISGRGGVWVLMPPYLLFYPDADRNDVPDRDPVVKLEGFGIEDTHSGANSLRWGPDGWLYGAHGSTCTANVKGVKFLGQAIWRYHPDTDRFEVFAEGGGNTFSMEFDAEGRAFSGTNHGRTRGLHYPQGSAFIKNWGKHGPLMNPYSFGFFQHMKHEGYAPRFAQTMIIYQGGAIPSLENQIVAGMALTSRVQASRLMRDTSSFQTADTDVLIGSSSRWFRPVDTKAGPDGAVYIADWCDSRLSHLDPRDNWDKESGRIYRIRAKGSRPFKTPDFWKLSEQQLLKELEAPNKWRRQTALRILHDRKPQSICSRLISQIESSKSQLALESLWALNAVGAFTPDVARRTLTHPHPMVRYWTLRLQGDAGVLADGMRDMLLERARYETDSEVRTQLAATARRLPAADCLPILDVMLRAEEDSKDLHLPLLLWWALESKIATHRADVLRLMRDPGLWQSALVRNTVLSRLAQRLTADRQPASFEAAAELLSMSANDTTLKLLLSGMDKGLAGDPVVEVPPPLAAAMDRLWKEQPHDSRLIRVAARLNHAPALQECISLLARAETKASTRSELVSLIAEKRITSAISTLMRLLESETSGKFQLELVGALRRFGTTRIASLFIERLPQLHKTAREAAIGAMSSRLEWAQLMLEAVDAEVIRAEWISVPQLIAIQSFGCDHCNGLIQKHWGNLRQSSEEKRLEVDRIRKVLRSGSGNSQAGAGLFQLLCANCHRLGGKGGRIGPDLTGYERDNLDFIIPAIVDPSLAIREEYTHFNLIGRDGQTLTGFLTRNDPGAVEIKDVSGNSQTIPRGEIIDLAASQTSLMPEGLLSSLDDQQIRDLFAHFISVPAK